MHADHIEKLDQGVVIKKSIAGYEVRQGDRSIACRISPYLHGQSRPEPGFGRSRGRSPSRTIRWRLGMSSRFIETGPGAGQILEVLPRRNRLARRAAASRPRRLCRRAGDRR